MVDIRKSTAQQLGVYGSRFQWPAQWWSSVQQWFTVTCPRMQMLLLIFCQSSEEELAFRDKELVFWSSGDLVQCASTTCSDCVSKQTIWRNIQFQNSYQSLRKSTLTLKKMTARVGLRVVTTGLRASQATCNFSLPRICALNMKPIVPTFGFNLGLSFIFTKLIQTISCPHCLDFFCLHPLFRFEGNLFISNFERQQFLHSHLWGWGVRGKAHCPGESDK